MFGFARAFAYMLFRACFLVRCERIARWLAPFAQTMGLLQCATPMALLKMAGLCHKCRAKGFVELRSVDGQSKIWQSVPASLLSALLYDDQNLAKVVDLLQPYSSRLYELWSASSKGLEGEIAEISKKLAELALEGFDRLPPCYKDGESRKVLRVFLENFTLKAKSPADDIIEAYNKNSKFTYAELLDVEQKWNDLLA